MEWGDGVKRREMGAKREEMAKRRGGGGTRGAGMKGRDGDNGER